MYNKCLKDPVGLPMIEDDIIDHMETIDMTLTGVDAVRILACHVNALRDIQWLRNRIQVEIESLQEIIKEQDNGSIPTHVACIKQILSDDKIRGLLPSHYLEQIDRVIKDTNGKSQRPVWNTLYRSEWNPHDALKDLI